MIGENIITKKALVLQDKMCIPKMTRAEPGEPKNVRGKSSNPKGVLGYETAIRFIVTISKIRSQRARDPCSSMLEGQESTWSKRAPGPSAQGICREEKPDQASLCSDGRELSKI